MLSLLGSSYSLEAKKSKRDQKKSLKDIFCSKFLNMLLERWLKSDKNHNVL